MVPSRQLVSWRWLKYKETKREKYQLGAPPETGTHSLNDHPDPKNPSKQQMTSSSPTRPPWGLFTCSSPLPPPPPSPVVGCSSVPPHLTFPLPNVLGLARQRSQTCRRVAVSGNSGARLQLRVLRDERALGGLRRTRERGARGLSAEEVHHDSLWRRFGDGGHPKGASLDSQVPQ